MNFTPLIVYFTVKTNNMDIDIVDQNYPNTNAIMVG